MKRGNSNQRSYAVILIVVISVFAGLLMIQNPSITGSAAVQTISYLTEGETLNFEVRNILNLKEATVTIVEDTKNSKIIFEEASPPASFDGLVISAFKISSLTEQNFGHIELLLKIKKSDLDSIAEQELIVYLEDQELVTNIAKKEADYIYYSTTSLDFGTFVIGRQDVKEVVALPEKIEAVPSTVQEPASVKIGFFRVLLNFLRQFIGA